MNQTIGEMAAAEPAAVRIFLRHKIDFCCGGKRSLDEACRAAGVDQAAIVREVAEEVARAVPSPGWQERPLPELIGHIERLYHDALRRDVPAVIAAARKVERVHAGKPGVPAGLGDVLADFWTDLVDHMHKEESVLFPMIARGLPGRTVAMPIHVMEGEHDHHAVSLARIRELTGDFEAPPHACATWRGLCDCLRTLEAELMQHIHLENNVLFPRALRAAI